MFSSKTVLFQLVVVACLAGLVVSIPSQGNDRNAVENPSTTVICDYCKVVSYRAKMNIGETLRNARDFCEGFAPPGDKERCSNKSMEIIEMVLQDSPEKVCTYLGFCAVPKSFSSAENQSASLSKGDDRNAVENPPTTVICDVCELMSARAKTNTRGAEAGLEQLCQGFALPEVRDKCSGKVEEVIKRLEKDSPRKFCSHLGFCAVPKNFSAAEIQSASLSKEDDCNAVEYPQTTVICDICKQISAKAKTNASEAAAGLEQLCQSFAPSEDKDRCSNSIEEVVERLQRDSPEKFCTHLGFCSV